MAHSDFIVDPVVVEIHQPGPSMGVRNLGEPTVECFGAWSVELSMIGVELTPDIPVDRVAELGKHAETAGFDTIFISCHYNNRDPFAALDRIAQHTDGVRLGPGVANPYGTHPVVLAARSATLQETSGGRAVFGIGAGDRSTLANLGIDRERPLRRILETVSVSRRLWAGERVDHDGTFQAVDAGLNFTVDPLPIYVGAQGPDMTRMAAKYADGVLFNGSHPRDFTWARHRVSEGLGDRPEHRGAFDLTAYASVSIAEDPDAAREAAKLPVAFIAAGAAPAVLQRHDLRRERADRLASAIENGKFDEAASLVTDRMVDAFCIVGTPSDVEARIAAAFEEVDGFVMGAPLGPDVDTAIDLAGDVLDRMGRV